MPQPAHWNGSITAAGERCSSAGPGCICAPWSTDSICPAAGRNIAPRLEAEPSTESLHRRLLALDPIAAGRIEPGNRRRLVRALEVCLGSGRPFSSFGPGLEAYPATDVVQLGLLWDRALLARRIETRVLTMLDAGLLAETEALLSGNGISRTARQALGYRELIEHLEGRRSYDEAVAAIVLRTRQFAVRQDRWFRRDPRVRWIRVEVDPVTEALPHLLEALDR